jgi:hypothetical protein
VFSNLFSITLPNIGKYFPEIHFSGIHFPKGNYFPANKRGLKKKKKKIKVVVGSRKPATHEVNPRPA